MIHLQKKSNYAIFGCFSDTSQNVFFALVYLLFSDNMGSNVFLRNDACCFKREVFFFQKLDTYETSGE